MIKWSGYFFLRLSVVCQSKRLLICINVINCKIYIIYLGKNNLGIFRRLLNENPSPLEPLNTENKVSNSLLSSSFNLYDNLHLILLIPLVPTVILTVFFQYFFNHIFSGHFLINFYYNNPVFFLPRVEAQFPDGLKVEEWDDWNVRMRLVRLPWDI